MFPYHQHNPEVWQTAYTRDQAFRDSGKHAGHSATFLLVGSLVISGFVMIRLSLVPALVEFNTRFGLWIALIIFLLISTVLAIIQSVANRLAADLFTRFYHPTEGIEPDTLINYRLYGKIKLPPPLNKFSKFESVTAKEGRIDKEDKWPSWSARNLGGPLSLTVFDGCALYLERGNRFSRVVGPGEKAPFLEWYETIKEVVDLRPRVKQDSFDVWTKDGIKVRLISRLECRIGAARKDVTGKLVYPFDPVAVKRAVELSSLGWSDPTKEPVELNWIDAAWGQVRDILPRYIGSRMLDDLLIAERDNGQILSSETTREFMEDLNDATSKFGVFITDFQITQIILPQKISGLQKDYWSAERQSKNTINEGKAKAYAIRTREEARAEAQRDLILAIADGLEKNPSKQFVEPLLLSLAGILDNSLADPQTRASLAKDTLDTLEKLQKMLERP